MDLALWALLRAVQVALQVTSERASRALQIVLPAKLLAQRRVLESNRAAVSRIELPIAEAVSFSHEMGTIELIVADDIDGDRATPMAAPAAAPIVMTGGGGGGSSAGSTPTGTGPGGGGGGGPGGATLLTLTLSDDFRLPLACALPRNC